MNCSTSNSSPPLRDLEVLAPEHRGRRPRRGAGTRWPAWQYPGTRAGAEVALGAILRERTSIPVIIENDANALAVGELHRGAAQGVSNLVAIVLETGLGTGIITNGKLYRGHAAQAGEIGYMLMDRSALGKMFPQRGDLELRLGSVAMTRQAREQGMSIPRRGVVECTAVLCPGTIGRCDRRTCRRGIPRHPVAGDCGDDECAESGARRARRGTSGGCRHAHSRNPGTPHRPHPPHTLDRPWRPTWRMPS